jgi:hypothetical protein
MKRLVACLGFILAAAACGSTYPAGPTTPGNTRAPSSAPKGTGPLPIPGTAIAADGRWPCENGDGDLCVEGGTITQNDPACFVDWDASGLCKQYDLVAREDSELLVAMRWNGPSRGLYDPDVFLVAADGRWEYAPDAWPEKHVSLAVRSGQTIRIVVLSYGSPLQFSLVLKTQQG